MLVDLRAVCAAAKSARRSNELSGGGCKPVCEPGPAVPCLIPGLSSSASAGAVAGKSGREAFARVGFAGSRLGFCGSLSDGFGITGIWAEAGREGRAIDHIPIQAGTFCPRG